MAWAGDENAFADFITRHDLTFPQISDNAGEVYARFSIPSQPAVVVVGTDGTTRTFLGAVDEASLDAALTDVAI